MILRRLALFLGLVCGLLATQVPEFVEQYRQRLGGAIDELAAVVAAFDRSSAERGVDESGGLDRLRSNRDRFVQQQGEQMQANISRLQSLREAASELRSDAPVARIATVLTHYDRQVATGTFRDFEPAVPTSSEAFVFGVAGFVFGAGIVHISGRPLRRRLRRPNEVPSTR